MRRLTRVLAVTAIAVKSGSPALAASLGDALRLHFIDVGQGAAYSVCRTSRTCLQLPRNSNPLQLHSRWPTRP